jgi:hypothetical protein
MAADLNLTLNGTPVPVYLGENATLALAQASRAEAAADAAAASEAVALAAAGPNYADTAAGLAATSEGDTFAVEDGGIVTIYRHDSGPTATELRVLPTTAALASTDPGKGAALVGVEGGGTVQDFANLYNKGAQVQETAWAGGGGGTNFNANSDINYILPGATGVVQFGGRGWINDAERIEGSRERNSYVQWAGYWPTGQIDIGGVTYDEFVPVTDLNPAANVDLIANIGGGDNFVGSLASANLWSFHSRAGLYGNHSWNVCTTFGTADGYYCGNLFGTNNTNFSNRGANIASYSCRIGTQGSDAATGIANASLTRHSLNIGSDQSSTDASHTLNINTKLSGHIRDFGQNRGFGISGEVFNGRNYGWAKRARGDSQVTEVLLSRTCTGATATTLSARGDWTVKSGSSTAENNNANGNIVLGTNTFVKVVAEIWAKQWDDDEYYYSSKLVALVTRDGDGNGTLLSLKEYELDTNSPQVGSISPGDPVSDDNPRNPAASWVADITIHATNGLLSVRFKPLAGQTVFVQADVKIIRQRDLSASSPLVPPIPFDTIT